MDGLMAPELAMKNDDDDDDDAVNFFPNIPHTWLVGGWNFLDRECLQQALDLACIVYYTCFSCQEESGLENEAIAYIVANEYLP